MALSDFEILKIEKAVAGFMERRRPPLHIRSELDFGYRIDGQSLELFEIRPQWDSPSEKVEQAIAKTTYVKRTRTWKVYWQRADLKWHCYDPVPEVESIKDFLDLVEADEFACFFG
ncbi:MAG: DUF3024 domain-containing protein [bacterium]|nr:DUF3024 domain-containing protein [bacterium]